MPDKSDDDRPRLSVRDLIPASRLAAIGHFEVSEPAVCDGDDEYEVNFTVADDSSSDDVDIERAFLKCIVGAEDAGKIEDLITYAEKNYWLGGKNIFLNLDVGKTISNRQTKLVLHNSKPRNATNFVSSKSKTLKKTDFRLEEWPYVTQNQPLLKSGDDENELPPWMRSKNKRLQKPKEIVKSVSGSSASGTPIGRHEPWQLLQHLSRHLLTGNFLFPPPLRQVFVAVPYISSSLPCRMLLNQQRWPGNSYRQTRFPAPLPPLPPPMPSFPVPQPRYQFWNHPVDTNLPAAVNAQ